MEYSEIAIEQVLQYICRAFCIPGKLVGWEQITRGNINTTFRVVCVEESEETIYLVQKMNTYVFREPEQVMRNIDLVTSHIRMKNEAAGILECRRQLSFYHTDVGKNYLMIQRHGEKEYWRVCNYISDSVAFDKISDPNIVYMAGAAFGQFEAQLLDFDATQLTETIPHFHDTRFRLNRFFRHVEEDSCGRCDEVRNEIQIIAQEKAFGCRLNEMQDKGDLPRRVTHNDTKINNILFDRRTLQPLTVIDLDTVMLGLVAYDFGDTIRSAANTAGNTADCNKIQLDLTLFQAFAEGYLKQMSGILSGEELESLATGTAVVTLELAIRYLDDYITGDSYFHAKYPKQNLEKARRQLYLFQDMIEKYDKMMHIIQNVTE